MEWLCIGLVKCPFSASELADPHPSTCRMWLETKIVCGSRFDATHAETVLLRYNFLECHHFYMIGKLF
jgi:hypothetical protein